MYRTALSPQVSMDVFPGKCAQGGPVWRVMFHCVVASCLHEPKSMRLQAIHKYHFQNPPSNFLTLYEGSQDNWNSTKLISVCGVEAITLLLTSWAVSEKPKYAHTASKDIGLVSIHFILTTALRGRLG